jgi:nucleotide-binding universal stress UspA family protein
MFKKILCATDGSEHSQVAVDQAIDLAKSEGAKLAFVMVNVAMGSMRAPLTYKWEESYVTKALATARTTAARAGLSDVEIVEIKSRDPASAIVQYADENAVDSIITGTGDRSIVSRLALGSVAREVAAKAHCSVTVAR